MKNYLLYIASFTYLITSCGIANNNLKFRSVPGQKNQTTLAVESNSSNQENPLVESSQNVNEIITASKIDARGEESFATVDQDISFNQVGRKPAHEAIPKKNEKPKTAQNDPIKNYKRAKNALTMGKLSFIPVIGWIFAIFAFILGGTAIARIEKDPETNDGLHEAKEGVRKAAISTIVGASICLGIFLFFIIAFAVS